jgi:hypothetical protein
MNRRFPALAVVALLALSACGGGESEPRTVAVEYALEATSGSDVTYATANGGTEQMSDLATGVVSWEMFDTGSFVYLSVQASSRNSTVSCEIRVGGRVVSRNESTGDFVIASCDGEAVPCPDCPAVQAAPTFAAPAGFTTFGSTGVAYRIRDDVVAECQNVTCVAIDLMAQKACPKGIYVDAVQRNAGGTVTGGGVAVSKKTIKPLFLRRVVLGWDSAPEGGSVGVVMLACR